MKSSRDSSTTPPPPENGPNDDLKNSDYTVLNPRLFVTGDAADAFGALQAGHTAWAQGQMAAENVLELIRAEKHGDISKAVLKEYFPPKYGIKVSLGRVSGVYKEFAQKGGEECVANVVVA